MTFVEQYHNSTTWWQRAIVMEIYHTVALQKELGWTITKTADVFNVSIGLVSENLRLAKAIHIIPDIINCKTRIDALEKIK